MALNTTRILSLLFTAVAMAAGLAHLLELPNKVSLSREQYLTVQQIYRGWAWLGTVILLALIFLVILMIQVRKTPDIFALVLLALLALVASQTVFWGFTYPANQATQNWTILPDNWQALRTRWEYSHAAGAVLDLIAFLALSVSIVRS